MPLADISTLVNGILAFSDPANGNFPVDVNETADKWADAMIVYLGTAIIPPGLASVLIKPAMVAAMVALAVPEPSAPGGMVFPPGSGAPALGNGFTALVAGAAAIPAVTVAPLALFAPPPLPPVTDPAAAAAILAAAAALWAITGTHVPPPGTAPPIPWS